MNTYKEVSYQLTGSEWTATVNGEALTSTSERGIRMKISYALKTGSAPVTAVAPGEPADPVPPVSETLATESEPVLDEDEDAEDDEDEGLPPSLDDEEQEPWEDAG